MSGLLGLAGRYWYVLAIASLLAFAGVQTARLNHAKADQVNSATGVKWQVEAKRDAGLLANAVRDLGQCRDNVVELGRAIETQNGRVEAWKAEAERMTDKAAEAAREAATARKKVERSAEAIMAARAGPDACQSADELITRSLQ